MTNDPLYSRALHLLQKSRQAFRLYSRSDQSAQKTLPTLSATQLTVDKTSLQELQRQAWRNTNAELIRTLGRILDASSPKTLPTELAHIHESFLIRFRDSQSLIRLRHDELLSAAEHGDFLAIPNIGITLVALKATAQAQQAAINELSNLLQSSKPSSTNLREKKKTLSDMPSVAPTGGAKVIPLRRARAS